MFNRVDKATIIFLKSLTPYMEETLTKVSEERKWEGHWSKNIRNGAKIKNIRPDGTVDWDLYDLVTTVNDNWNDIFTFTFVAGSRTGPQANISKLYELRNILAHQRLGRQFTSKDVFSFLDNAESFVRAVGDVAAANEIDAIFVEHAVSIGKSRAKILLAQFQKVELARKKPALYGFLRRELLDSAPLYVQNRQELMVQELTIAGQKRRIEIPIKVLTRAGRINLGSAPNALVDERDPNAAQDEHVKRLRAINQLRRGNNQGERTFYNCPLYALKSISVSDDDTECTITGTFSDYFSMLATHAMEFELLSSLSNLNTGAGLSANFGDLLIKRKIIRSQRRPSALSLSALMVVKNKKGSGYRIRVLKRGQDVAVHAGQFSLIPGGMFQPEFPGDKEWNISHCLIKEYCEELFSMEAELNADDPYYIYSDWEAAKTLYSALADGEQCKLLYSGVILNLLNLDAEICCVLLVEDADWYERQKRRTNWEYLGLGEILRTDRTATTEYDLDLVEEQFAADVTVFDDTTGPKIVSRWVPDSLASFWLGIHAVREHLDSKHKQKNLRPNMFIPFLE